VIPELGQMALALALALSLALAVVPLVGAQSQRHAGWMALGRPLAWALAAAVVASFAALTWAFVVNDFTVKYVAEHSNTQLPLAYRVAGVWGGHEGSLLLWALMQVGWIVAVASFSRTLPVPMVARILAVLGWVTFGFLLFTLAASNPFERLIPAPPDGRDLNPLLQDPGMVLHPPMLYMGYVGFSVAFAFAVAALIGGRLDATWARWTRPWTTSAWLFLTIGIALGSWWAYYELGWGGWWFWDPVENASFMPWLVGTALIHSLAVTEKRNGFKAWTVLLAITAFTLSLLGTFLVRSGLLSSVHAFAADPSRGVFILVFIAVVTGASLALFAWRAPTLGLGQRFGTLSRESLLLGNNVLLAAAMGAVLLGTLYPLVVEAAGWGTLSVGPPYFDAVFAAVMAPLVLLLGLGTFAHWKDDSLRALLHRVRWHALAAVAATAVCVALGAAPSWLAAAGLLMAWWIVASTAFEIKARWASAPRALWGLAHAPRALWGMWLAHLGVAVFIFGVTVVRTHETQRDVPLAVGASAELGPWRFTLNRLHEVQGPNYLALQADFAVQRNGVDVTVLAPQKRLYPSQPSPMTEAAIRSRIGGDLYISMGEPLPDGRWLIRFQSKPLVTWIWGGCALMALGGALAASDRRYRRPRPAATAAESEGLRVGA
jgi:cytochrome c-type biogenesis protein CcmF